MNYKFFSAYFSFSKSHRTGLLVLLILIVVLQTIYFFVDFGSPIKTNSEKEKWLAFQTEIDSLKELAKYEGTRLYPFNPNYISDYKGYKLGMSVQEIDRLLAYRKQNKFVNSADEFQKVTGISDSLLKTMVSYFKFPDWVNQKRKSYSNSASDTFVTFSKKKKINIQDINTAGSEDLEKIFGIGEVTAKRILSFKERFGAFVSMEQLNDIWGLSAEVVANLQEHFEIKTLTGIKKLDINNASINELAQFPYFKYALAKQIVIYRSMNGPIVETADLTKIKGMPNDKIKIIALYLDF
jgi:DNA uptake protein ComE-like DNA-binding protein